MTKPTTAITQPAAGGVYSSGTVTVGFDYHDPDLDAMSSATVEVARNAAFTQDLQSRTTTAKSASFTLGDGLWYARARVKDTTGLWSDWSNAVMFYVDQAGPTLALKRTSPAVTSNRNISLSLVATDDISGVQSMQITTSTSSPGSAVPFQSSYTYVLPVGDGQYTIYARAIDKAGNPSAWQSVSVSLDTKPPTVAVFAINQGSARADGTAVTLNASVNDPNGVESMSLSNDGVNWSPAMSYSATTPWVLAGQVGTQTVFARFYDQAGNMVQVNDSILFLPDTTDLIVSIRLNGGQEVTYQDAITAEVAASDNATPAAELQMRVGIGADNWGPWVPYTSAPFSITLPAPGRHLVYVQIQDTNGNTGSAIGEIFYASGGAGDPPPATEANTLFRAVLTGGGYQEITPVTVFGEQLWATPTTVLEVKSPLTGQQYSAVGDGIWSDIDGHITIASPPGPFPIWIRNRLADQTYSAPQQYKFLYDPIPPTASAHWSTTPPPPPAQTRASSSPPPTTSSRPRISPTPTASTKAPRGKRFRRKRTAHER